MARLKEIQGLGIRPKVIFWMGWPVAVFMIVAITLIAPR
ncbi:preprotein translocase subunit Sec61beta [Sphingomonas sp. PL20]